MRSFPKLNVALILVFLGFLCFVTGPNWRIGAVIATESDSMSDQRDVEVKEQAQRKTLKGEPQKLRINPDLIKLEKNLDRISREIESDIQLRKQPPPLSSEEQLSAVNHVRKLAGLRELEFRPPARIVLTPREPWSGKSCIRASKPSFWNCLDRGLPDGGIYLDDKFANLNPYASFVFEPLVPGNIYLVDITVAPVDWPWQMRGVYEGVVTPQSGHILQAFIARYETEVVRLHPEDGSWGWVYRAELIKID